jgi:hypothetical protein
MAQPQPTDHDGGYPALAYNFAPSQQWYESRNPPGVSRPSEIERLQMVMIESFRTLDKRLEETEAIVRRFVLPSESSDSTRASSYGVIVRLPKQKSRSS